MLKAYDAGSLQMSSPEIGEPENDMPYHPWHEELLYNARQVVATLATLPSPPSPDAGAWEARMHDFVASYEFRGDGSDHVPSDDEREMIEDAIEGYLAQISLGGRREEIARLRGALENIAVYGCGMLGQPPALNSPEEAWLRMRLAEYERCARDALASPPSAGMDGLARLSASEVACYRWPEDTTEHRAMRAAFCDGAIHITTLASSPMEGRWEERAIAVLNKMLEAYDTGNLQMNSNEIGEPENNIPYHPWHEELIWNARQAVALSRPARSPIENGGLSATPHEGNGPCE
jgi:hypothetical protein